MAGMFRKKQDCHLGHVDDTSMGSRAIYDLITQTLVLVWREEMLDPKSWVNSK